MARALIRVCERVTEKLRLPVHYLPADQVIDANGELIYGMIDTNDTPAAYYRSICLNGELDIRLIAHTFAHELGHYYDPALDYFGSSSSIHERYESDTAGCEMVAEGVAVLLSNYFWLITEANSQIPVGWIEAYFDWISGGENGFARFTANDKLQARADAAARNIMLSHQRQPGDQEFSGWLYEMRAAEGRETLGVGLADVLLAKAVDWVARRQTSR